MSTDDILVYLFLLFTPNLISHVIVKNYIFKTLCFSKKVICANLVFNIFSPRFILVVHLAIFGVVFSLITH